MKRLLLVIAVAVMAVSHASAQKQIVGIVFDEQTDEPLPGATVRVGQTYIGTATDFEGMFVIKKLDDRPYKINVTYIGYETKIIDITPSAGDTIKINLAKRAYVSEEVSIVATRANKNTGTTFTTVEKEHLVKQNLGQDLPIMLNLTPSVVTTSDAGAGIGYTGIRIRGSDQTRINVTINGIPLNDAESQNIFWVNLPDFSSSIENIQIQRGVGTSTNGAGAFGGSINVQTNNLRKDAYAQSNHALGSFNTIKNNVQFGTGLINDKFVVEGRLSKITSDGYIDRAFSDLKSFYLSAGRFGKRSLLKFNVLSGKEETFQAWYGIPQDSLETNPTLNVVDYDNEIDNYQQDHYQLHYSYELSDNFNLNTALHYTYGRGYFEQFRTEDPLADYNMSDVIIGNDTITTTDLIRRRWLDNDFYGMTYSLNYDSKNNFSAILGGAYNVYQGQHFGEVIWSRFAGMGNIRDRYYDNDATKTDFNTYIKSFYEVIPGLTLFADLEYRQVNYEFLGFDANGNNVTQEDNLEFLNPKFGVTYVFENGNNLYASFARGSKEPSRDDYTESSPASRPEHEELNNVELGYQMQKKKYALGANLYYMGYTNQLVLTGEVNDVGAYTRRNIDRSFRAGLEIVFAYSPIEKLNISGNATISRNEIQEFTEFIDDFTLGVQLRREYENTNIAFSPELIGAVDVSYTPIKNLELRLTTKHVGEQNLDNTSSPDRILEAYTINDLIISYSFKTKWIKGITLRAMANNILDINYAANGYTFSYADDGVVTTENWVYPQAGTNFLGQVTFDF